MSDFPQLLLPADVAHVTLSSLGPGSPVGDIASTLGQSVTTSSSLGTASLALFIPVIVPRQVTVSGFGWNNGSTVSGNVDVGLYDFFGNRLASAGSTAQTGTSAFQGVTLGTSVTIGPDVYYLAIVQDNTTGQFLRVAASASPLLRVTGCQQMAAAFPLPSVATFAACTMTVIPGFAAQIESVM
jgi:hypothetical protein